MGFEGRVRTALVKGMRNASALSKTKVVASSEISAKDLRASTYVFSSKKEIEGILRRLGAVCPILNMRSPAFKDGLALDIEQALEKAYAYGHAAGRAGK